MSLNKGLLVVVCVLGFMLIACKKKEIPGPAGDQGLAGIDGKSYINSISFPVQSSQWVVDSVAKHWAVTLESYLITKEVYDKGSVKVFVRIDSLWQELPFLDDDTFTQFGFEPGRVKLVVTDMHSTVPLRPATSQYRIVTISEH